MINMLSDIKFANRRPHRAQINHPAFIPKSPQVVQSNLSVTPTGAAVVVRPPRTALRRMTTAGSGEVAYV